MAARLRLTLLGGLHARVGSQPVVIPLKKAQALLAYLALPAGRTHAREHLAALLWGDRAADQARNSLRQTLFGLRRALAGAPSCLQLTADTVSLRPAAVEVDVATLERLAAGGTDEAVAAASSLYHGGLLQGLPVMDPEFDDWLTRERERVRQVIVAALTGALGRQVEAAPAAAIQTAQRLVGIDPLQESVHRTLMRLYLQQGQRASALRQYRACAGALQRDLAVEPEPATRALYREIVQHREPATGAAGGGAAHAVAVPLVGRQRELAALAERLAEAGAGQGQIVALLGEAGIGKTRLTEELCLGAGRHDCLVLRARAYETGRILPLGLWAEALRSEALACAQALGEPSPAWLRDLARLFPELARGRPRGGGGDTLRLFEALARLVGHLAERQPLLVVLEDLHWADEMSLRFLAFLGRRLRAWPVLLALTARVEEIDHAALLPATLAELAAERCVRSMALGGLSRPDTAALIRALRPAAADPGGAGRLVERIWTMSAGNPFVITEAVRSLHQATGAPATPALPDRVQEVILQRVRRLSERSQQLVAVAAVIGREFPFALLQRAAGMDEREAADGVEELTRRQVLRDIGDHFDFTHDRIREAVYRHLLAPRRRLLHGAVAAALEALHRGRLEPHVAALAVHALAAQRWAEAVPYLRAAGAEAAARGAYREAVALFEQALAALAHVPRDRRTTEQAIDLRFDLRDWLMPLGELARLHACLDEARALAAGLDDERRRALAAGHLAHCLWLRGEPDRALSLAQHTADVAAALGDLTLEVLGNFYLGEAYNALGDYPRAVQCLARNAELVKGERTLERFAGPGLVPLQSRCWLAVSLAELGELAEALAIAEEAHGAAESVSHPYSLAYAKLTLGRLHVARGAADVAIPILEQALGLVESRSIVLNRAMALSLLGAAYVRTGRAREGLRLLADGVARAAELQRSGHALIVGRLAEALLLTGRPDEALGHGREALALARAQRERGHEAWATGLLAEIHAALPAPEVAEAERLYRGALALGTTLRMRPLIEHCQAALSRLLA